MNAIGEFDLRRAHLPRVWGDSDLICRLEDRNAPTPVSYTATVSVIDPSGATVNYTGTITYDPASQAYMTFLGQYQTQLDGFVQSATSFGSSSANGVADSQDGSNVYLDGSLDSGQQLIESVASLDQTYSSAIGAGVGGYYSNDTDPAQTEGQAYVDALGLLNRNVAIAGRLKAIGQDIAKAENSPLGTLVKWSYYRGEVQSLTKEAASNLSKLQDLATRFPNVYPGSPLGGGQK